MTDVVVETKNLKKFFGGGKSLVRAVNGVNLSVKKGEIFGFLGPNGAGKTTTLRILTTLLPLDSGKAIVAGIDVTKNPQEVRRRIGYVSQVGGSDRAALGIENLVLQGRLYGMGKKDATDRAKEIINAIDLKAFADRMVSTYSGGERRRLDVALGLMNRPSILFLDEPTTGLDPQNRAKLWEEIKALQKAGTTIFLTTHYLEEADILADRLSIMDYGKIVAEGTPRDLKKQIAGDVLSIGVENQDKNADELVSLLRQQKFVRDVTREDNNLRVYVQNGETALPEILRLLEQQKLVLKTVSLSVPSLDDVFLKKTGRSLRTGSEGGKE